MRYLLDTNPLSAIVRDPDSPVAAHIQRVGADAVCTSVIVAAEMRYGAMRRASPRLTAQVEATLDSIDVLAFETPADARYAELRNRLERAGTPIGGNDLLIAAHALALGHTLVTGNEREFLRVAGLPLENWLRDPR